jgi:peptidyl-prolyl cis-trans isomerase B (cyclophilin B)
MKNYTCLKVACFLMATLLFYSCSTEKDHLVTIKTRFGDMKIILFDQTPKHKQNFIKLAKEGMLDSTTFHRVIENFMIQGGDVNAKPNVEEPVNYTIEAEFVDTLIHVKGNLAAARMGDQQNPTKASSGTQFYIVHGQKFSEEELRHIVEGAYMNEMQRRFGALLSNPKYKTLREEVIELQNAGDMEGIFDKIEQYETVLIDEFGPVKKKSLTQKQIKAYTSVGGSPHLDGEYTVFGKVIDGVAVIDSIATLPTGPGDKPLQDVYMTVEVEEMSKRKIEKEYGYVYPEVQ